MEAKAYAAGKQSSNHTYPILYAPDILMKEFDSPVADMKNSVAGRTNAQASCAGHFIQQHLKNGVDFEGTWFHVDMAYPSDENPYVKGRGTGYGVALMSSIFSEYLDKNRVFYE